MAQKKNVSNQEREFEELVFTVRVGVYGTQWDDSKVAAALTEALKALEPGDIVGFNVITGSGAQEDKANMSARAVLTLDQQNAVLQFIAGFEDAVKVLDEVYHDSLYEEGYSASELRWKYYTISELKRLIVLIDPNQAKFL